MSQLKCFGDRRVAFAVALLVLHACSGSATPIAPVDASSDRGGSAGSAGTSGGTPDAGPTRDAPGADGGMEMPDGSHADNDAAPCIVDPDAAVTCPPQELPPDDDCPDAAPSYTTEVAAIIAAKCTVCHRPGGLEPVNQFDTRAKIVKNNNNIHMLTQVYACRMPQACGEPLTMDERQKLLQWLVCGAPNN